MTGDLLHLLEKRYRITAHKKRSGGCVTLRESQQVVKSKRKNLFATQEDPHGCKWLNHQRLILQLSSTLVDKVVDSLRRHTFAILQLQTKNVDKVVICFKMWATEGIFGFLLVPYVPQNAPKLPSVMPLL